MDTRLLKTFCAVAKSGSLVAAAATVRLTPSAISHSLKALETDLNCRLFERVGKKMVLNQAGEQLLAQVQRPLAALDSAAEEIKRLGRWGQTRLRVGTSAAACQHLLPRVIRELKKAHASLDLHVEAGDTPRVLQWLRDSKIDIGLGITPDNPAGLELRPIFRDELLFVFAPSHPWAGRKPLTPDDIRTQPLIVYQRASLTGHLLDEYFRQLEIVPHTVMDVDSIGAISELVKLNLGVSILAPWTVDHELAHGTLKVRPLGPKPLRRQWSTMSLASRRMTLAEETFCRLCRNYAAGLRLERRDVSALNGFHQSKSSSSLKRISEAVESVESGE